MKIIRLLLVTGIAVLALAWFSHGSYPRVFNSAGVKKERDHPNETKHSKKLEQIAIAAKAFVHRKGFNENTCFLIDMSLASGQNRFFIYDLKNDSVRAAGLVAHGNCFEYWLEGRRYSNKVGSGCTSLGKYRIGIPYTGKFGHSYKLHGLDTSNNNAFERTVVLHSHSCIPGKEGAGDICQSNGCPTVSPDFLKVLTPIINKSGKPVLLWIYE